MPTQPRVIQPGGLHGERPVHEREEELDLEVGLVLGDVEPLLQVLEPEAVGVDVGGRARPQHVLLLFGERARLLATRTEHAEPQLHSQLPRVYHLLDDQRLDFWPRADYPAPAVDGHLDRSCRIKLEL